MLRRWMLVGCVCALVPLPLQVGRAQPARGLDVYFVDVEGGQATLFVSPSGQSMLVDTGFPGARDADRISDVAKLAGVKQIDYLVTTHYHLDHVGGVADLVSRLPIRAFVDHGPSYERSRAAPPELFDAYANVRAKGRHIIVTPGASVPIDGIDIRIVSAGGEVLSGPIEGGGADNALCREFVPRADDPSENARSVGMIVRFGSFRLLNLGDLTWNTEQRLMCPRNLLGRVDVYLTTHHGQNSSGPAVLVHAVRPRVAVMNNGAQKGGSREAFELLRTSPGLEDLWQLHTAVNAPASNSAERFIANPDETTAHFIKLSVRPDGSFVLLNSRNRFEKTYSPRR